MAPHAADHAADHAKYNLAQFAEAGGVSEEAALVFWRTLGFPAPDPEAQIFTTDDVEALRRSAAWVAEGSLDERSAVSVGRAIAHTSERLVLWQVEAFVDDIARRLSVDDTAARLVVLNRIDDFREVLEEQLVYAWHRHLDALLERIAGEVAQARATANERGARALPLVRAVGFADVVSSTEYLASLDSGGLAQFVQRFESVARDVISAGGARVVKTIGDAVLFVADTPEIGTRVALELVAAMANTPGVLPVRVGLVWGRLLSRFGDVFGPPVNLAARLTDLAKPSTVLTDRATATRLAQIPELKIDFVPMFEREVQGLGTVFPVEVKARPGETDTFFA